MLSERGAKQCVTICSVVFVLFVFAASWWHWWTFAYSTFDLAFYVQSLWLALRGGWVVSLLNVPMLGNHAEPIVFLALPLFAICPHPMLLVALQSIAIATMPWTAWRIARRLSLEANTALFLAVAIVLTPVTGFVALHEFHPEALAAPLLLLLIEARIARRLGLFWCWLVALIACKENLALLIVGWSAVHLCTDHARGRKWQLTWNVLPLAFAAAWLALYLTVLSPNLNKGNVDYLELYSHLGRSPGEIIRNLVERPQFAWTTVRTALTTGNLVWGLILPFLALPLLRPKWLLLGLPVLVPHLLSWRPSEWSIEAHYGAPLIPLVWMAAASAVVSFRSRARWALAMVVASLVAQLAMGPIRTVAAEIPAAREKFWERGWKADLLSSIPPGASVTAGIPYLSHLATRAELFSLHHVLKGLKTLGRGEATIPLTDAVVVDYGDMATFNVHAGFYHPPMRTADGRVVASSDRLLHDYLSQASWSMRSVNTLHLFLRGSPASTFSFDPTPLAVAPGMELLAVEHFDHADGVEFHFAWHFTEMRQRFPWVLVVASDGTHEYPRWMGACAIDAREGTAIEVWRAKFLPKLPMSQMRFRLIVYEHGVAAWQNEMPPANSRHVFRDIMLGPPRPSAAAASR